MVSSQIEKADSFREIAPSAIIGFLVLMFVSGIFFLRLETRIDAGGVYVKFSPLGFTRKHFAWEEIEEIFVRTYSPIAEYGGWGIRGLGRAKAYNVSGNRGIQIVTRAGKRFLIGTNEPATVERVLKYYRQKQTDKIFTK